MTIILFDYEEERRKRRLMAETGISFETGFAGYGAGGAYTAPLLKWELTLTVGTWSDRLGRNATQGDLEPDTVTVADGTEVEIPHLYHDNSDDRIVVNTRSNSFARLLAGSYIVFSDGLKGALTVSGTQLRLEDSDSGYDESSPWVVGEVIAVDLYSSDPGSVALPATPEQPVTSDLPWESTLTVGGDVSDESGFSSGSFGALSDTTLLVDGTECGISAIAYSVGDGGWVVYTTTGACETNLTGLWLKIGDAAAVELTTARRLSGATHGFSISSSDLAAPTWSAGDTVTVGITEDDPG